MKIKTTITIVTYANLVETNKDNYTITFDMNKISKMLLSQPKIMEVFS